MTAQAAAGGDGATGALPQRAPPPPRESMVRFIRLLRATENLYHALANTGASSTDAAWARGASSDAAAQRLRLGTYLAELRRLLDQLKRDHEEARGEELQPSHTLAEYEHKVAFLAELCAAADGNRPAVSMSHGSAHLLDRTLLARNSTTAKPLSAAASLSAAEAGSGQTPGGDGETMRMVSRATGSTENAASAQRALLETENAAQRSALFATRSQQQDYSSAGIRRRLGLGADGASPSGGGAASRELERDKEFREGVMDDMLQLLEGIRERSEQASSTLHADQARIDAVDGLVSRNLHSVRGEIARLDRAMAASGWSCKVYLGIVLVVLAGWITMYFVIKFVPRID